MSTEPTPARHRGGRRGPGALFSRKSGDGVRHDLEGLRAVAVLGVVIYHLRPSWLPGGFAGVDVFFVLSGFFITGLLLREIERTGTVSLARFWARRARRLLPASALVIVATLIAAHWMVNPLEAQRVSRDGFFASIFAMNWRSAYKQTLYLQDPDPSPFVHYWSLGVEEQFYVAWPLLLLLLALLWRVARRRGWLSPRVTVIVVGVALGVPSFVLAYSQTDTANSYAYFGTFERIWQLALGGICAAVIGHVVRVPWFVRSVARWLGLAVVIGFYFGASTTIVYPGWDALVPVAGAALIVLAGEPRRPRDPVSWAMCTPVAQLGGRYSYSWYLWHWPPLVLLPIYLDRPLRIRELGYCAIGTFAAAVLTYHLLENPIRQNRWLAARHGGRSLALGAVLVVLGLGLAQGATAMANHDAAHSAPRNAQGRVLVPQPAQAAADYARVYADNCVGPLNHETPELQTGNSEFPNCRYLPDTGRGDVALVGDSHGAMWFPAVQSIAEKERWGLSVYLRNSCPFSDVTKDIGHPYLACDGFLDNVMAALLKNKPGLVVVASADNHFSPIYARDARGKPTGKILTGKAEIAAYTAGMSHFIRILRQAGIQVLVIGDNPGYPPTLTGPDCVLKNPKNFAVCSLPQLKARPPFQANLTAGKRVPGVSTIDFTKVFCKKARCYQVIGHILAYRDNSHLTTPMVMLLRPPLAAAMRSALAGHPVNAVAPASAGAN